MAVKVGAAVGAHLPLHAGRGIAAGRRREAGRAARDDRLIGRVRGHAGAVWTVSVAAVVVAVPTLLVKTASYW